MKGFTRWGPRGKGYFYTGALFSGVLLLGAMGALVSGAFVSGCFVSGKDYGGESTGPRSCEIDDDCYMDESCEEGFCETAEGCLQCTSLPNGKSVCFHGLCLMEVCESGWNDANGLYQDGCEYECDVTNEGVELCDEVDNDCDGQVDEDFDLMHDPKNCGECGKICPAPDHAESLCAGGICYFQCEEGW